MNAKIKRIVTIGSLLAAATAAVGAHAADQTRFFEEQVQLTDGYAPDNRESAAPPKGVGNDESDAQRNWLEEQMRLSDGYTPPGASAREASRPALAKPKTSGPMSSVGD